MKIDIICSSRELFGSDRSAVRLAQVLTTLGHYPTLVLPRARPERGLTEYARIRSISTVIADVSIASSKGFEKLGALRPRMRSAIGPEITIYNTSAVLGCERPSGRRLVMIREWLERDRRSHTLLVRWHERHAEAIVGISRGVLAQWDSLRRTSKRTFLCWNWLDSGMAERARRLALEVSTRAGVICLGRFNNWKGQELLAAAYESALVSKPALPPLSFIGAQEDAEFRGRAKTLTEQGTSAGWRVIPFRDDPLGQLAESALVVVPSLRPEPFGMVLLEALATGCRVIATAGGGPSDLAPLFPHALELCSRSPFDLAERLGTWAQNGAAGQSARELDQSHATIEEWFSPAAAGARWREILDQIA